MHRTLANLWLAWAIVLMASCGLAAAQSPGGGAFADVPLVGVEVEVTAGAVTLRHAGVTLVYVDGLGWLSDLDSPPPRLVDGVAWAAPAVARQLGLAAPPPSGPTTAPAATEGARLLAVRVGSGDPLRVVLDLEGLEADALRPLGTVGRVEAGTPLRLDLPPLLLPATLPSSAGGLTLRWLPGDRGVGLEVSGSGFAYDVFSLAHPTRLVVDLRPDRGGVPVETESVRSPAPGVLVRTFRAAGAGGPSRVHVVEVAPGVGQWQVVGATDETRTTVSWAAGAPVAINGGYFEPANRSTIGLLVVDGVWLSPPSRGRAAVGFGPGGVVIDRVATRTGLWLDGRVALSVDHELAHAVTVHTATGTWAGSGREGALVVDGDDRVIDNRIGPVRVPTGGRVVVYPPEVRSVALAEPGTHVRLETVVSPPAFAAARYAVEAGPLLVRDGRDAFAPEIEAFARGVRILDEVTQQAAIGVRSDGTVLLVAAEAMVAADLVPLFLDLGAVHAMRLDSGGSTTLLAAGEVLNRRTERAVTNAIVWRPGAP